MRVEGTRLDAQTADGQLIQTDISNAMSDEKKPITTATEKPKTADKKSVPPGENKADRRGAENKAILNAPENKSGK